METLSGRTQESLYQDIYVGEQGVPSNLDDPVFGSVGCSGPAEPHRDRSGPGLVHT
jgi:hypothetical protein